MGGATTREDTGWDGDAEPHWHVLQIAVSRCSGQANDRESVGCSAVVIAGEPPGRLEAGRLRLSGVMCEVERPSFTAQRNWPSLLLYSVELRCCCGKWNEQSPDSNRVCHSSTAVAVFVALSLAAIRQASPA